MTEVPIPARQFTVPLGQATTRIPGFRAGVDRCRITVGDLDTTLLIEQARGGVALVLQMASGEVVVGFPGLDRLPLPDIVVSVDQPGAPPHDICLDGVVDAAPAAALETVQSDALKPRRRSRPITEFVLRPGQSIPSFSSFAPGAHVIEVDVTSATDAPPKVEIRPSADGENGVLMLDGRAAAILAGAPFATPDDVRVLTRSDG